MLPVLIVQNCQAETAGTIIDYLMEKNYPYQIVHNYKKQVLPDTSKVRAVINLGCPISVTDYCQYPFLKELYRFVAETVRRNKPYLGICFGGQLLAKVLGAKVYPNKVKEIGTYQVTLSNEGKDDHLFQGFDNEFPVFHWHGDTFNIPFGSQLLVEGTDCKNQSFRKGMAVALQFHLEVLPKEVSLWCDTYRHELDEVKKTKSEIITSFNKQSDLIKELNFRLLDNFFSL